MADIEIQRDNPFSKDDALTRIQTMTQKLQDKIGVKVAWSGDQAKFSGPVKGEIRVSDATINIEVKLGLAAKLLKGKISEKIEQGLDQALS